MRQKMRTGKAQTYVVWLLGACFMALGLALMIFSGCGGSGNTGIAALTGAGSGVGGTAAQPLSTLDEGWRYFRLGESNYDNATTVFTDILNLNVNSATKSSAFAGLGWIDIRTNGPDSAGTADFLQALSYDTSNSEASIGLGMIYLTREGNEEIGYFQNAGLGDPDFQYASDFLNVTAAEAQALMALAYYQNGFSASAEVHIDEALELEPNNLTIQQVAESMENLGY